MKKYVKDFIIYALFLISAIFAIISKSVESSVNVDNIIGTLILHTLGFAGLMSIFQYCNLNVFIPNTLLDAWDKHKHKELETFAQEWMKNYYIQDINYVENYSQDRIQYILSQLGINNQQFDKIRMELLEVRTMNIATIDDAQKKLQKLLQTKSVVVKQSGDPSKRTYPEVQYYVDLIGLTCYPNFLYELACTFRKLIIERLGRYKINKIIIPYDSNFRLAYKVSELMNIPFAIIRSADTGKIIEDNPWDGKIEATDNAIIIHDVLVTGFQVQKSIEKIICKFPQYNIVGIFCLIQRKEKNAQELLESYTIHSLMHIDDKDIAEIIK